jgi:hypothetical protein
MMWSKGEAGTTLAATYTETALPIPGIPTFELENDVVTSTIEKNPHLFKIVTPIRVDCLRLILCGHPNCALVESLCRGFEQGFWPFADTSSTREKGADSDNHDPPLDNEAMEFLRQQRDEEIIAGRYSASFGTSLLPGMVSQPIFAVPKPGSSKFRLINDHSAGEQSLNSLIPADGGFVKLDNLQDLGRNVRAEMRRRGGDPKWLFKSDASQAYRRIPVHPRWQVRQATKIDGEYHVDRNAVFGNRASGRLWCLFFGVVLWVAIHTFGIEDLNGYVDDVFSHDFDNELELYRPYNKLMPKKQANLLRLWDLIGLAHEERKQIFGRRPCN